MPGLWCLTEELAVWRKKCIILESASEVQARAMQRFRKVPYIFRWNPGLAAGWQELRGSFAVSIPYADRSKYKLCARISGVGTYKTESDQIIIL